MKRYKFPRTYHLPCSLSKTDDDKTLPDFSIFEKMREVVITEKMDGESFTCYSDAYCHARSIDSRHHESRSLAKAHISTIYHLIPDGWRISCENVYAQHSIGYDNLKGYLYLLAVWDGDNVCCSFDELLLWATTFDLPTPKVLYRGKFSEEVVKKLIQELDFEKVEGFVIRNSDEFYFDDYSKNVGKFVRANHVQTDEHWMNKEIIPNKLWTVN